MAKTARNKKKVKHFIKHSHTLGVSDKKIQAEIIGFVILTAVLVVTLFAFLR
jgi:hypothetical protein